MAKQKENLESNDSVGTEPKVEENRAQGPVNTAEQQYVVKHSLFGAFPAGYVMNYKDIQQMHPGFGEADLKRALAIGAIAPTEAPKTVEPPPPGPDVMAASQRKLDAERASREVKTE